MSSLKDLNESVYSAFAFSSKTPSMSSEPRSPKSH